MGVRRPVGVLGPRALANDVAGLIDDRDSLRRGDLAHPGEHARPRSLDPGLHQNDDRCAVSVGARLELAQSKGGVLQGVLEDGRQLALPEGGRKLSGAGRAPLPEQRSVARSLPELLHPAPEVVPRIEAQQSAKALGAQVQHQPRSFADGGRATGQPGTGGSGQPELLVLGVRRAHNHRAVGAPLRACTRKVFRIPASLSQAGGQCPQHRSVVHEVVVDKNQDQQLGTQPPRIFVVVRQLLYLARVGSPVGRSRDLQSRQRACRQPLEHDMELGVDRNLVRFHEGVADHCDVAAGRGSLGARGFSIHEAEGVGARDGPEVLPIGVAHFRVRLPEVADVGNVLDRQADRHERTPVPQPEFAGDGRRPDSASEQEDVPRDDPQRRSDGRARVGAPRTSPPVAHCAHCRSR